MYKALHTGSQTLYSKALPQRQTLTISKGLLPVSELHHSDNQGSIRVPELQAQTQPYFFESPSVFQLRHLSE